jgi:hypothetical protein
VYFPDLAWTCSSTLSTISCTTRYDQLYEKRENPAWTAGACLFGFGASLPLSLGHRLLGCLHDFKGGHGTLVDASMVSVPSLGCLQLVEMDGPTNWDS